MRKVIVISILQIVLLSSNSIALDNTFPFQKMLPPGMKMKMDTIEANIIKVYSAEDNGALFRAYVVKWNDSEVIVSDPLGTTDNKVGDSITFMAQRTEMPKDNNVMKMLNFTIMDFSAFMKMK